MSKQSHLAPVGRARIEQSRLSPPERRGRICERRELLQSLDEALNTKVTLIIGPAGYGKTTIVAQWCKRLIARQLAVAYYSVSERDREPATFLYMLANALNLAGVDMAESLALADADIQPGPALDDLLLRIELSGQPLFVILDDFERVENPETTATVKAFLEASPPSVHLVIVSRRRPQIPLAALDVQGQVRRIDASNLRLRLDELAWLLELSPDSQEAAEIAARTEGWPVAVELYRLWLERRSPDHETRFGGHVAEVTEYLTEQLLSSLPDEQQNLLTEIARWEEVGPAFVDCVRQRSDSARLLDETARNLSTLVLREEGAEEPIYRLHPLLREYLRDRLLKEPKLFARLSANAAVWYLQHHRYPDAVRSALDGHDEEVMGRVMRSLRPVHLVLGEGFAVLRSILREIPESFIARHPRLQLMAALTRFRAGFFAEGRAMLERIRESTNGFTNDPDGKPNWLAAEGNLIELVFRGQLMRPSSRIETLYSATMAASDDDAIVWGACENVMVLASQQRGQLVSAKESIRKTRRIYESVGLLRYGKLQIIGQELLIALAEADLRHATELIAGYQKQPTLECEDDVSIPSMLKLALAAIRYEREFDEQSVELLKKALAEYGTSECLFDHYAVVYPCMLMRLNLQEGLDAVLHYVASARAHAVTTGIEPLAVLLNALEVEFRARNGELARATEIAQAAALQSVAAGTADASGSPTWRERDSAAQALILLQLAQGQVKEALSGAQALAGEGQLGGRLRTQIKGLIFVSLALAAAKEERRARGELLKAVLLAYPQGFVAPFAEEGGRLSPLLAALAAENTCDAFARRHVKRLLAVIAHGMPSAKTTDLNEREREIVHYLAQGASNKAIGRRLGITENTVKFHLKKIFSKLDISTRRAAAAKLAEQRLTNEPLAAPPYPSSPAAAETR